MVFRIYIKLNGKLIYHKIYKRERHCVNIMTKWNNLGITGNEFKIYETLLRNGASTVSSISDRSGLDQRSVYDYIERLINKGLVGQIIHNNKRMFLGLNPEMMSFLIDEEKAEVESEFDMFEKAAKIEEHGIQMHVISCKSDLIRMIKSVEGADEVFIGEDCKDIIKNPSFVFFLDNNKPKINWFKKVTKAAVIVIFSKDMFLIYSVPEEKGFFVKDCDFANNMRVYLK